MINGASDAPAWRAYRGVTIGQESAIGDFAVLGVPPAGTTDGELELRIGPAAVIRSHAVLYAGSVIGARFAAGHGALVRERCVIGDGVSVGSHAVVEHSVRLGDGVRIHSGAFVPEFCVLEDGAWIGPGATLTNARFPASPGTKPRLQGVTLRRSAKVGANATLMPGVTIGEGALVAAGAVVTRDVPAGTVVAGVPARVVGQVSELRWPEDINGLPGEPAYPASDAP